MFKKLFIVLLSIPTVSFAAQIINFQSSKPTSTLSTAPIPPSDFSNQVKSINTQNHTQFKQQLDQQKSALPPPKILSLSQVQSISQTQPPAASANVDNTQPTSPTKPNTKSKNTVVPQNNNVPFDNTEGTMPPPPSSSNGAPPPPPAASPSQPYTGFPTQNQTGNTNAPKSGGFQVQY